MPDSAEARTAKLIADLWKRSQPLILERLATLDQAAAFAQSGTLDEPQREAAESIAHKLSGSLGMFGFHQGTVIARDLEAELRAESPRPTRIAALVVSLRAALVSPIE